LGTPPFGLEKLFDSHTSGATGSEQESNNIPARGLWPAGAAAPLGPVQQLPGAPAHQLRSAASFALLGSEGEPPDARLAEDCGLLLHAKGLPAGGQEYCKCLSTRVALEWHSFAPVFPTSNFFPHFLHYPGQHLRQLQAGIH